MATTEPADGLWTGENDEIYLSSIANNAVKVINPADGSVRQVLTDSRLRWPDTFSQGPDGAIYVTASHIQDSPWFHMAWTDKNFALFKFMPGEANSVGSHREPAVSGGNYATSRRGGPHVRWVEPIAGTLLMASVLADVSSRVVRLVPTVWAWKALSRSASARGTSVAGRGHG